MKFQHRTQSLTTPAALGFPGCSAGGSILCVTHGEGDRLDLSAARVPVGETVCDTLEFHKYAAAQHGKAANTSYVFYLLGVIFMGVDAIKLMVATFAPRRCANLARFQPLLPRKPSN